ADTHMPPRDSGKTISPRQVALIKRWIEQGAKWEAHWAFIPPRRPAIPRVKNRTRVRNPIDAFVLSRLEREGLRFSPQAAKTALIRRVTLDLTGLPPTLKEIDAFLADKSPRAYERVVDRLLKSQRFGEQMAVHWLDAARYADTSGYQNDGPRDMWRWRDYVIESFNANKPFDEFAVEQLAGDMLPNATLEQKIATAFNRNHRGNAEGGTIPEEFQVEYVVDRVETTFTVFQGVTMGCVRCHEHKFDPISHKEFYRVFAYFNNIPENGRAIKEGNSPPFLKAPTKSQQKRLAELTRQLQAATKRFRAMQPKLAAAQREWETRFSNREKQATDWSVNRGLVVHFPLDGNLTNRAKPSSGKTPRFIGGPPTFAGGRLGNGAEFDGKRLIVAGPLADFGYFDKFSFGAWVFPTDKRGGTIPSKMTDVDRGDGYALVLKNGKLHFNLVKRWLDDSIRVETKLSLPAGRWSHVFATYDGSRVAKGLRISVDGKAWPLKVNLDGINQSFAAKGAPLRIGGGSGPQSRFRGRIDDVRVYARDLSAAEVAVVSVPESVSAIVGTPRERRTAAQRLKLRAYFLAKRAPAEIRAANARLVELRRQRASFVERLPTVMVMQEMKTPRKTFVLRRGEYDKPGDRVTPGIPKGLAGGATVSPRTRLEFARWIVDRKNPLTARVTVNRFWQALFGIGIVKTTEDFGSQGERPSHPKLLDWLAVEFMENGWNVKRLLKTIVMSATYRQTSRVSTNPESEIRYPKFVDPENRLLSRGPRFRMSAEMIRDQALFAAGLLTERIGGPSVKPYQPDGLWKEIATDGDYVQSHGGDLYRRSMYTYWKRTVAPPVMLAFDAPDRESCRVRRARTNTPLQALALLNDVTFLEAARVLAERALTEGGNSPAARIAYAFRLTTARRPRPAELRILTAGFRAHRAHYRKDRKAAERLVSTGEAKRDPKLDAAELAAYTATTSLILNLDEVVTKE
ncbi:MAG: DUF1553 domain-containing protein, partial [Planctomycetaceae bacterium]